MSEKKSPATLVTQPIKEIKGEPEVKGRTPSLTFMSDKFVPQTGVYIRWGWIFAMPEPNPHMHPHSHNFDEIVIHIGSDPMDPDDLGGELEFTVNGEPIIINKSSALYIPKGIRHGPLTWKRVTKPHIEMTVMIGTGEFLKARPGGYINELLGDNN
jgi:hypothetical protein